MTFLTNSVESASLKSKKPIEQKSKNLVIGYLPISRTLNYDNIDFRNLTHVIQSFMCPISGENPSLRYNGDETVFLKYEDLQEKSFLGFGSKLVTKAHAQDVKVILGLCGGHDLHAKDLMAIFANDELRKQFIANVTETCEKRGYDGIDLDYEYPESADEGLGILKFVSELRTSFDANTTLAKRGMTITLACPKFDNYGKWFDFKSLSKYCDWFNIMTYAYEASFTKLAGHNCPLYPDQAAIDAGRGGSVSGSMYDYFVKERGISPEKLVMGLGFYGWLHQGYTSVYAPKSKSSSISYTTVFNKYLNHPDWTKNWSEVSKVPYLLNDKTKEMITYDDEKSIKLKCAYAKEKGFKGVMIWELSNGYTPGTTPNQPLLQATADVMFSFAIEKKMNIIPEPAKTELFPGIFLISPTDQIYFTPKHPELSKQAKFLSSVIESVSGNQLKTTKSRNMATIKLIISEDKIIGNEGYKFVVDQKGITISANTDKGIFYGIQTLLQTLPASRTTEPLVVPCLKITDYPRFQWRGMMLDVSRHFFSPQVVKNYIDLLASYKMNVFHWHLADAEGWRLEIKKYPKLTSVGAWRKEIPGSIFYKKNQVLSGEPISYGGFYTQDQVKEIVAYAKARNVTVVPEIEMPGHSDAALAAYPEFGCTGKPQQVRTSAGPLPGAEANFCAGKEQTFAFLQDVLQEVMQLFPSTYIHIGGDEVDKKCWENCTLCQQRMKKEGLKDVKELQSYFIKRMGKFITGKSRKMIGWDEILEGGLAPNATVMSWRGEKGGIEAAKMQHDVVMTPAKTLYFNRYQADTIAFKQPLAPKFSISTIKKVYDYNPIPVELNSSDAHFVLGAQGCIWTEFISTVPHLEQMTMPRMLALSEVLWSIEEKKNWERFKEKVCTHTGRLGSRDIGFFVSDLCP